MAVIVDIYCEHVAQDREVNLRARVIVSPPMEVNCPVDKPSVIEPRNLNLGALIGRQGPVFVEVVFVLSTLPKERIADLKNQSHSESP
jgi:hypothetical protein